MTFTTTWNANFEASPPDTGENHSLGANRIRLLKNSIRERLAIDHYFAIAGTDEDHGEHSQITFHGNLATPANVANKGTLYPQLVSTKLEVFYKNNANQIVQITSNGALNVAVGPIPANTVMIFYADTAPSGWTIQNTSDWSDRTIMLTRGSVAGGDTGGVNNANGTWQQANHTLTVAETPPHTHQLVGYECWPRDINYGVSQPLVYSGVANTNTSSVGGNDAHNHGATWRPASKNFIACSKN